MRIVPISDPTTMHAQLDKLPPPLLTAPKESAVIEIFNLLHSPGVLMKCRCGEVLFQRVTVSLYRCTECGSAWNSGHSPLCKLVKVEGAT